MKNKYCLERRDYIKEPELDIISGNLQDYIISISNLLETIGLTFNSK